MIVNIILGVLLVLMVIAFIYQLRATRKQADESAAILRDYQHRMDEQQRLLDDYHGLEKTFDSVGKGYEKALLAFDKMEEEKQTLIQVKEALLKQVEELTEAKNRLEAQLQHEG